MLKRKIFPGINPKREADTLLSSEMPTGTQPQHSQNLRRKPSRSTIAVTPPPTATNYRPPAPTLATIPLQIPAAASPSSQFIQKARLTDIRPEAARTNLQDNDTIWGTTTSDQEGYHGQSSTEVLSRDAGILREGFTADQLPSSIAQTARRFEFWHPSNAEMRMLNNNPWDTGKGLALELPPANLMPELIDAFFNNTNYIFPMLHRPLFEKQLQEGLHMREPNFLRVVMLVCANGSRWSSDPRVLEDKWPVTLSAGYRWFKQVESWNQNFTRHSTLWDAQIMLVSIPF
jgi:hypothetical protein